VPVEWTALAGAPFRACPVVSDTSIEAALQPVKLLEGIGKRGASCLSRPGLKGRTDAA
jgi:hypothetical protein